MQGTATFQSRSSNHVGVGGYNINIPNIQRVPIQSHYHAVINFDHNTLRGTVNLRGNVNAVGSFTGTRNGDTCYTISDQDGRRSTSRCTMSMVALSEDYTNAQGQHIQTHTEATRTASVDLAERDRQIAAKAAKLQSEYQAYLSSLSPAGRKHAQQFSQILQMDSRGWVRDQLDPFSVRNVHTQKGNGNSTILYGEFTSNGGSPGWMKASLTGESVNCVEFYNFPGKCRPLGQSGGQGILAGIVGAMARDMMTPDPPKKTHMACGTDDDTGQRVCAEVPND